MAVDDPAETHPQPLGHAVGLGLHLAGGGDTQGRVARGGAIRVGVEGAAVQHPLVAVVLAVAGLHHHLHYVVTASYCASGKAAGEDLGHGAKVRLDAQPLLQAAGTPAETGNDLVQDHHDAVLPGEFPYTLHEALLPRHRAIRCAGPLGYHPGNIVVVGQGLFKDVQVRRQALLPSQPLLGGCRWMRGSRRVAGCRALRSRASRGSGTPTE